MCFYASFSSISMFLHIKLNGGNIMLYGKGYNGGEYKTKINRKPTKCYYTWQRMLERCYSTNYHEKEPTYIG